MNKIEVEKREINKAYKKEKWYKGMCPELTEDLGLNHGSTTYTSNGDL